MAGTTRSEKTVGWRLLSFIVIPFLLLVGRYRFRNVDKLPAGAFILAPNHYSNFDPLVTAYALWRAGRVPRFLAKASLFRVPVLGAILRATGQIPVERAGTTAGADPLAAASRLVDDGLAVIVYPEGTLTRDPQMWPMRGRFGAVRLSLEHGIPIVPCAHWGVQEILPRYSKKLSIFPRKNVDVIFGEPVDLSPWQDKPKTGATYAAATTAVMQSITKLLEELRGERAPLERWDPAEHGQTEFGRLEN
ncbi:1-acyl-sn-glycerol-3-phosphate acyltransferase [Microbacteriaceae bacterium SG_E_30_P1]|uniref:1-acyl-sn-glycerol-3-phosphate acyltransferase n=1 Tax=Antiquaquibacter oligotrophicus TaxID=2880260 RepID=A0ABT6KNB0_9MICO|nr:lysophospholipid acyltransferase family protein [Antiquaquibacter oligotrophicus]MDH6181486.1 1-acyl-sn-glycerol-3-phosphate acyltransferase [Antiquaquibacter oligotrophicus]UDF12824.1 1-acyl-sn-glycerol-3-phosphate acyltransferase [Antiquaquibacter oligotrophicus]